MPLLVAGRANGRIRSGGRRLRYPDETPVANLFVSMLEVIEAPVESFGDSTGSLGGIFGS